MAKKPIKRCAIYTRKSSEEGLELEYNSLHAQRDSAEAFIKSQKHEGWQVVKEGYDDGGISGGHMDRQALQRMLCDLKAGKIDVVVVYKVDRLSRSLADFAQMMKIFDAHEVSFVSVTQQFNTSSSMGRLTLNVLLSFAQFEREVTGERIRDKIALSKKKGRWTGGMPPLGYDAQGGKIILNIEEAEVVKQCFKIYLESSGLIEATNTLNQRGMRTKHYISLKGRVYASKPWIAKLLHRVLTQPIYYGMVQHKGELFEGEHEAIIDIVTWEETKRKLKRQQPDFQKAFSSTNRRGVEYTQHALKGYVFTDDGYALTPTFTSKTKKAADGTPQKKRYRYYVSQKAIGEGYASSKIKTVNALLLEKTVQQMITQSLPSLSGLIDLEGESKKSDQDRLTRYAEYLMSLEVHEEEFKQIVVNLNPKITVGVNQISIHIQLKKLKKLFAAEPKTKPVTAEQSISSFIPNVDTEIAASKLVIEAPLNLKFSRGKTELLDSNTGKVISPSQVMPNANLVQAIVQAEFWRHQLIENPTKSLSELMQPYSVSHHYIRRLINAAYLAPEIKKAIFQGTQPQSLKVQDLTRKHPMDWSKQKKELGFV